MISEGHHIGGTSNRYTPIEFTHSADRDKTPTRTVWAHAVEERLHPLEVDAIAAGMEPA